MRRLLYHRIVETFDVAIIGAGLIGSSIALELSRERFKILVLDKRQPGREASWAAAGMLSPAPESEKDLPLVPLARESLRLYPEFVAGVENESGKMCGYARQGSFEVFTGEAAARERDETIALLRRLGLAACAMTLDEAREKGLPKGSLAEAVAFLEQEGTIDPRLLMDAVLTAAQHRGVQFRANCEVNSLLIEGERCAGVVAYEPIAAKHVVLAAGCYSGTIGTTSGISKPLAATRPVRGQMVALKCDGFRLERVVRSKGGYLVPRPDGRIVAGSTIEKVGFQNRVTAKGIRDILKMATELCPELLDAEVVETWSGLRPGTPDALPMLGAGDSEGLIIATGHYRNGILLAPITAKVIRDVIVQGESSFPIEPFSPSRFDRASAAAR